MKNRSTQPLFSIGVLAFTLTAGAFYLGNQEQPKGQTEIQPQAPAPEPTVLTIPPVEIAAPFPEPIAINLNTPAPPVVKPAVHKVKVAQAPKVERPAGPCELVCEDDWNESAYGTHYKNCKCK
jgi:hypothetical protein